MREIVRWVPAAVLGVGALFTVGIDTQRSMSLVRPLEEAVPRSIAGFAARDVTISDAELQVAGVTNYLMLAFEPPTTVAGGAAFSIYVGYYDRQTQGQTIHSPKNCLPGAGWEALASDAVTIHTAAGAVTVNRYLLQSKQQQALVLYWYQGRGRVEANEYVVKWDLLRDAALRQRSEEALVRIVVPITESQDQAFDLAARAAEALVPALNRALPG